MALQKELWLMDIEKNLYANNEFLRMVGKDHSSFVNNITVHIPQAGGDPSVVKNRSLLPATAAQRTDSDLTYNLSPYTTDPVVVSRLEDFQISYDKRMSIMQGTIDKMNNVIGNQTLYGWAATGSSRIIRTSGSNSTMALAPSATGTRKALTLTDIRTAAKVLDKDNVNPNDERFIILPSDMYWELLGDSNISKYLEFGQATAASGEVPMLAGFKLIKRSSVVVFDNTGTPVIKTINDEGVPTSAATSDNYGALAISSSYVAKAVGSMDVFIDEKKPEYYGDVISALVYHGATKMRTNQEGIVSIVQSA